MNSLIQVLSGSAVFMAYAKKLWDTVVISEADNSSLLAFRTLELLLNLSAGDACTTPCNLHQLLVESEFTEHSE